MSTQCLVYEINSLVDKGEVIELNEIEKLVENKEILNFLQDKFGIIELYSIKDEYKEKIENALYEHSNYFESYTSRKKFHITNNGYLMLSSALVELIVQNIL